MRALHRARRNSNAAARSIALQHTVPRAVSAFTRTLLQSEHLIGQATPPTATMVRVAISAAAAAAVAAAAAAGVADATSSAAPLPCHFARAFTCDDFLHTAGAVDTFIDAVMVAEGGGFGVAGVGYDAATGYTFDGQPLNSTDGSASGPPHPFSAPSKESLHVGMLAAAVAGNARAAAFTGGADAAVALLGVKMAGYEAWNATYPGFGCFMPWVTVGAGPLAPNSDWVGRVPGLDNGEWAWALLAAATALRGAGVAALADRYAAYFACMAGNAQTIFYMGGGNVSSVVLIANASAPVTPANYNQSTGGYLNDPYEGELLTVLLDLYGRWDTAEEREALWLVKRPLLQAVNYTTPAGDVVTAQRGWWFSSHEQWKTMMLPYLDVPVVADVFANCERVRTADAAASRLPGLLASVNDVTNGSVVIPDYISAAGVQAVAFQPVTRRDVVTPYGAWPLMLHNVSVGLCWYAAMLAAPRMQGPHGSTEAVAVNGTEISPLTTWDSKVTTVLALAGGIVDLTRAALAARADAPTGVPTGATSYQRFTTVMAREYGLAFPVVAGVGTPYYTPTVAVPPVLPDWASCP